MTITTLIFDWDGTLADSEAAIVNAMRAAFEQFGEPPPPHAAVRDIIGLSLIESVTRLRPGLSPQARQAVIRAYGQNYVRLGESPALFAGVRETLTTLRNAGYALAVATGKSDRGLRRALTDTDTHGLFVSTQTADLTAPKPAPDMLHVIAAELDITPTEALVIGDTEYDLAMARSAGMHVAGVTYGAHAAERLRAFDPLFMLDEMTELPARLAEL